MLKASPISPSGLLHLLRDPSKLRIFDVRDSDYGEYGIIKNSINLPYALVPQYISEEVEKALADKIKDIVTYCRYGRARSVITANKFAEEIISQDPHADIKVHFLKDGIRSILLNKDYYDLLEDPMKKMM